MLGLFRGQLSHHQKSFRSMSCNAKHWVTSLKPQRTDFKYQVVWSSDGIIGPPHSVGIEQRPVEGREASLLNRPFSCWASSVLKFDSWDLSIFLTTDSSNKILFCKWNKELLVGFSSNLASSAYLCAVDESIDLFNASRFALLLPKESRTCEKISKGSPYQWSLRGHYHAAGIKQVARIGGFASWRTHRRVQSNKRYFYFRKQRRAICLTREPAPCGVVIPF